MEHHLLLSSTVTNKELNKRFIGLQWSTINLLLDSVFDENIFAQKESIARVIGKNSQKKIFRKIFDFPEM